MIKDKFFQAIKEFNLINPGDVVLVAVSGGADSICLLNLLNEFKDQLGIKLHVAHLNHLLRRGEAEADMRFVQSLGQALGLPVAVESIDVEEYAKNNSLGLEAAARVVRYDFLARVASNVSATKIAVGHTADDNVETFLMRLLRGSGLKGLCGIPPQRGNIIRPLIKVWRREIEDYVGSLKLVPRRDHTNYESKYLRNRVRLKLIPQLKIYNLNIKEIILQTILLLTDDNSYIESKAEALLATAISSSSSQEIRLSLAVLKNIERPIRSHVIRQAIGKVRGNLLELSYSHVQEILDKLEAKERWELNLPGGIFALGSREVLTFSLKPPLAVEPVQYRYPLSIPGELEIKEIGKTIRASLVGKKEVTDDVAVAFLDHDYLSKKLVVRSRNEGDSFSPLGLRGTKKLQDFFVDEKVPAEARDLVPIVTNGKDIVWVGGMRIDERAKVKKDSKKIVKLELL